MFYAGLSALYYDVFFQPDQEELLFYHEQLNVTQGPALELGVGTGRMLLELIKLGHDVEGVDCSREMLAECARKAARDKVQPILYQQSIQALALKKKYGCIFSPLGTFQQISDRHDACEVLKRCYEHLLPAGKLILYTYLPWHNAASYGEWHQHEPVVLPDGNMLVVHEKAVHDLMEQQLFMSYRYELWRDKEVLAQEKKEQTIRWFSRYELEGMLKAAGFQNTLVLAGYQDQGPFDVQIFIANK